MANATKGHFVWYEYLASDPKAAIDFYTDVIGWTTQPFGDTGYNMWVGDQGPLGGVMQIPEEAAKMGTPPNWMGHVLVDDVDKTASMAKELGGKVYKEPEDIPTVGRFAVIADPQGAVLSIFKSSGNMELHEQFKAKEVSWRELLTSDSAAAFQFYSKLFGWKSIQDMDMGPMGVYRIYGVGDLPLGGMMTLPPGAPMPPAWLYYTEVPSLEAVMSKATAKGAKVLNGPMDVPGGRIAQMLDNQGGAFAIHQSVKQ